MASYVVQHGGNDVTCELSCSQLHLFVTLFLSCVVNRSSHWPENKGSLPKEHAIVAASRNAASNGPPTETWNGEFTYSSCVLPCRRKTICTRVRFSFIQTVRSSSYHERSNFIDLMQIWRLLISIKSMSKCSHILFTVWYRNIK